MSTTALSIRHPGQHTTSESDKAAAIRNSKNFETLFSNLEHMKYSGYDPQSGSVVRQREAIAIIVNTLIRPQQWKGRIVVIGGTGKKLIDQDDDSPVRIPVRLIRDDTFVQFFVQWNAALRDSEWPYESIPQDHGLKDKVKALLGLQTQEELDRLNPKHEVEYAPGSIAKITYETKP